MERSYASSLRNLRGIVSFLSFSGCGHSLLSSMIDAHRNAIVSREQLLLNKLYLGRIDKDKMLKAAIVSSGKYTQLGRFHKGSNTSHLVPNQSNGVSSDIHILGDKHGFGVVAYINGCSDYLSRLNSILMLPIYFIHMQRNPLDVIAHTRKFETRHSISMIAKKVESKFLLLREALKKVGKSNYLTVSYEELVNHCDDTLIKILDFLHLDSYKGFTADCAKIVDKSKVNEWDDVNWTPLSLEIAHKLCLENGYACQRLSLD